jgi:hypothetical protein
VVVVFVWATKFEVGMWGGLLSGSNNGFTFFVCKYPTQPHMTLIMPQVYRTGWWRASQLLGLKKCGEVGYKRFVVAKRLVREHVRRAESPVPLNPPSHPLVWGDVNMIQGVPYNEGYKTTSYMVFNERIAKILFSL